ncbi:fetuin-B isoform X3 [Neomonachus schauinslandi]|uniref:Fetuin-B isoform X3 n=1 Tax=Neomonachus schauinslandi TaxID=29088 RepID=A0A2Y9HEG2_NEOSC|nr:fetuin-B isoform X3 [Neomonachus schauinslandi]
MGLLLPLVLCTLAACCRARSPPMPPPPLLVLPRGCNDSDVLTFAGFALQDINRDRKDGYILGLNRVSDVHEHRQAISQRKIYRICPDCPRAIDLSDPKVLEVALESLAKYNSESTSKQYSLVQVTQASSQWMAGFSYFVEYLIRESPCTKSQASSCALQLHDSEPVGLCKGSVTSGVMEKFVSVTCDFFEQQVPAPGGEDPAVNQGPAHLPGLEESQQKIVSPTPNLPPKAVPKGSVQYLPDLDDEKPEDAEENSPVEAFPVKLDLTTNPWGESLDVSFLFLGPVEEKLVVLPFPKKAQHSAECPGPAQQDNTLILPP